MARRSLPLPLIVALLAVGVPGLAAAQQPDWIVQDAPVEADGPGLPVVEPHLTVDPDDPDHLLAGAIVVGPERPPWHCAALASFDGGRSWTRTDFDDMERCIDPWVVTLPGDTALFAGIEIVADAEASGRFRLYLRRSTDGGLSWGSPPDTLGRRFEHPVLEPGSSGPGPTLYLGALRFTEASDAAGRAGWIGRLEGPDRTRARRTATLPEARGFTVTGVHALGDGTLVVTYREFYDPDGGGAGPEEGEEEAGARRARGRAVRSMDGGRSFARPVPIDDGCGSGRIAEAFPGYPVSARARGEGPHRDHLYHACVRPDLAGISLTRSADGGATWSEPVRIDTAAGAEGTPHARTAMVAASAGGGVAVAWYDRRHDRERACQHVYLSVSRDGGRSFGRPVRLTTEESCPENPGNGGVARSWPMGGDYGALDATADGTFHLLWSDARDGPFQLRRSTFRILPD